MGGDGSETGLGIGGDIPDLDTVFGGGSEPLMSGVPGKGVDDTVTLVFGPWLLQITVVPDFDDLVLSTGGNVHTISGNSKSIDERIMSLDGSVELEDTVPDLQSSIPADGSIV